jgi:CheY-like chemotaxis protein
MSSDSNSETGDFQADDNASSADATGDSQTGDSYCTPVVLVVEDDTLTRKAVARKLQAAGYEVVAVPSAGDALIVSQRLVFHVLVLDLNLVGNDDPFSGLHEGFAVIDWLRHQLGNFPFRIVIYSSQVQKHVVERARACGAFAFCPKRRDMDNLLQSVHDAIVSLNEEQGGEQAAG